MLFSMASLEANASARVTRVPNDRPVRSSNHRASLAVLVGLLAVLMVPGGVAVAERLPSVDLIDASWSIPFAFALGLLAFGLGNLARTRTFWSVGRTGGERRVRAARLLGGLGICLALAASISVGTYEVLLRLEH
jgi:hypothetical protein